MYGTLNKAISAYRLESDTEGVRGLTWAVEAVRRERERERLFAVR
jgi:hypothetical protein